MPSLNFAEATEREDCLAGRHTALPTIFKIAPQEYAFEVGFDNAEIPHCVE